MRIVKVKKSQRKQGRFLVELENGEILRVAEKELVQFHLHPGKALDDAALDSLHASARLSNTKSQAARMLSARPLSKKELTDRLIQKGNDESDAQNTADWMEEMGAISDIACAAAIARHYGGKGYGAARVREEFSRRGIDRDLWEQALAEMPEPAEVLTYEIQKMQRIQDRTGEDLTDPRARKRVRDRLLRRGFSWDEVETALARYMEGRDEAK